MADINKLFKNQQFCMGLAVAVLLIVGVYFYNERMGQEHHTSGMSGSMGALSAYQANESADTSDVASSSTQKQAQQAPQSHGVSPAMPFGMNGGFGSAEGMQTETAGIPPNCASQQIENPSALLPSSHPNFMGGPGGEGELQNVNLLKAGQLAGIDTVGSTLRNANLQVRSEPANPRTQVSPWMNSTIEPDLMRVPLEIGCGSQ